MTPITDDMVKTNKKMCEKCIHSWKGNKQDPMCHYILDTGKRRGCPVGWCNKFEQRKRGRKKNG